MEQSVFQQIIVFIAGNAHWAGPLSFGLACAASIIGPNFVVPVGTILVGVGTLVGGGLIPWTIVIWAASGAAAGTGTSFTIGRWLGPWITGSFLLRDRADYVGRAHALFEAYGSAAVFVGYFSGPLRAVVAVTAGVVGMGNVRFHLINVLAAPVWAVATLAQGAVIGAAIGTDHPLFLAAPIATPVFVAGVSLIGALLWSAWRKVAERRGTPAAQFENEACNHNQRSQR